MNLLKEPYNPNYYKFGYEHEGYGSIQDKYITIHSGKTQVNWIGVASAGAVAVASALIAIAWIPILLINIVTILIWIAAPKSRLFNQITWRWKIQEGSDSYHFKQVRGANINWKLAENPIYKEAIGEWLEDVRRSERIGIAKSRWDRYFDNLGELVRENEVQPDYGPDFGKLKLLKEIMSIQDTA